MSASTDVPSTNGKAPVTSSNGLRSREGVINVQPARLEDLQPRYAQKIQHAEDNPEAHGWYAALSEYIAPCVLYLN